MSWADGVPAIAVAMMWLIVPGLAVALALKLRGLALAGMAPALSVALISMASLGCALLDVRWQPVPVIVLTAAAAGAAYFLRRGVTELDSLGMLIAQFGGVALGLLSGLHTIGRGLRSPDAISQTYDAVFHYNAIAMIAQTGKVSPFVLGALDSPGAEGKFYPAGWHAIASLTQISANSSPIVAANAVAAVVTVLVWPAGCALLARQILGRSWIVAGVPFLSLAFLPFPWTLLKWGVLWPLTLGFALIPVILALLLSATGLAARDLVGPRVAWVLLPAVLTGMALVHPVALGSCVLIAVAIVATVVPRIWVAAALGVAGTGLLLARGSQTLQTMFSTHWAAFETPAQAVGEALFLATNRNGDAFLPASAHHPLFAVLAVLIVVGSVGAWSSTSKRWLVIAHVVIIALYVVAASKSSALARLLTGFWFNDSYRLAALLAVTGVPLAVLGLQAVVDAVRLRTRSWPEPVAAGLVLVMFAVVTGAGYRTDRIRMVAGGYSDRPGDSTLITPQQREFFTAVAQVVPQDQVVAGSPWNASPLLYPLTGTRVLFQHLVGAWSDDQRILALHLTEAAQRPEVCQAARRLNVRYLITGGGPFWPNAPTANDYPGLAEPRPETGFELVLQSGPLKLFQLSACQAEKSPVG